MAKRHPVVPEIYHTLRDHYLRLLGSAKQFTLRLATSTGEHHSESGTREQSWKLPSDAEGLNMTARPQSAAVATP